MKLEKFRNVSKKNITVKLSTIIIIIILLVGIIIYESYALYEEKKSFNVLNGTVPVFGEISRKIELAYTIEGSASNDPFPNINDGYGAKKVTCENGVEAEWNDVAWSLIIKNSKNNKQIKCTIDFIKTKIYGAERTQKGNWIRTNDAQGLVANAQVGTTAVRNDFDNIYPWSDIKSYNYNTSTKEITAWYGDAGFKFDGTNGEVLTYIPEFYYKRYQDEGKEYISIANRRLEGYTKSEAFSIGRYPISGNASGVHSKSGVVPFVNDTITNYRTYARNLGEGFSQMDYHYFIIQLLYLVEYADYDSQAKLGLGIYNSVTLNSSIKNGGCDALGMHSGSRDGTSNTSMIYRGIEDIYGYLWQFVDGINIKDNNTYICYDQTQYVSDKFDGCYKKIGYVNSQSNGWVKELGYDANNPLIAMPVETSSGTIVDYYYQNTGNNIVGVGGSGTDSNQSGLWAWDISHDSSTKTPIAGARLIKIN